LRHTHKNVGKLGVFAAALASLIALTALAPESIAQSPPQDIKQKLLEQRWARPAPPIYDQALAAAPKDGIKVTKDLSFGKHERQKVDIYQPEGKSGLPIMVFVHGGGYTASARDTSPLIHANILTYFARNGFLGVNADYRLAPEFKWPSGGQDVAGVVAWLKANARTYGGDPDKIYLFGHSAGASHVALYGFDRRFQPGTGPGIAGMILLSGRYKLYPDTDDPSLATGVAAYFGTDPERAESRSVTTHVGGSKVPVMLVISEFDQLNLVGTTGDLFVELCKRDGGQCPRMLQLKYHNHFSEFQHFNTEDDYFGQEVIEWVNEGFAGTRRTAH
jgi:acetyl esterase